MKDNTLQQIRDELVAIRMLLLHMNEGGQFQKIDDREKLSKCNLSFRVYNTLAENGIYTVGDLKKYSLSDFKKMRNIGGYSIMELTSFISDNLIMIAGSEIKVKPR